MTKTTLAAARIAAALALLASGCATMQSTDWTRHDISEVVKGLGQPTEVTPSADGSVYVWKQARTEVKSDTFNGIEQPHNGFDAYPYVRVWRFWVDTGGKITRYSMERRPWSAPSN